MDTPPSSFGLSKKSALKNELNKSKKMVRFDQSADYQRCQLQKAREREERDREHDKKEQQIFDSLITQMNGIPFDGTSFDTPPPMDPRQIMEAREKMNSFLSFSPPRSSASYATPPQMNSSFSSSRFGPIGTGRPSSSTFQSSFNTSKGFHTSFNTSKAFNQLFKTSNNFNSSAFNTSNSSFNRTNDSYKTALCNQFRATGTCSYGVECKYAHGVDQLRTPPSAKPNYKTVLCKNFYANNECPHGSRCKFIHHRREENRFQSSSTSIFAGSRGHL